MMVGVIHKAWRTFRHDFHDTINLHRRGRERGVCMCVCVCVCVRGAREGDGGMKRLDKRDLLTREERKTDETILAVTKGTAIKDETSVD